MEALRYQPGEKEIDTVNVLDSLISKLVLKTEMKALKNLLNGIIIVKTTLLSEQYM